MVARCARSWMLAMLAALLLAFAACGDDDDGDGSESGGGRQGGSITISQSAQPDFLDPALSYTLSGWEPMWLVYTPPLTYRRAEGEEGARLIPGVAKELPEISPDGRVYELNLRKGLVYSDGTPAKASDFEHTIKRVLNLESGGSSHFLGIEGAEEYVEAGKAAADIRGIETDDATGRIKITLSAPDGTFSHVLAELLRSGADRYPLRELDRAPAAGHRALQDHRVRAQPPLRSREERPV